MYFHCPVYVAGPKSDFDSYKQVTLVAMSKDGLSFKAEGTNFPLAPSARGEVKEPVRQLRDPALFESKGHAYLIYAVAGESGLAIAELFWK